MNNTIENLCRKTVAECPCIILNNRYICSFTTLNGKIFKSWILEDYCLRFTTNTLVNIYDKETKTNFSGTLFIYCDKDLNNLYSMSLLKNDNDKSLIHCSNYKFNL